MFHSNILFSAVFFCGFVDLQIVYVSHNFTCINHDLWTMEMKQKPVKGKKHRETLLWEEKQLINHGKSGLVRFSRSFGTNKLTWRVNLMVFWLGNWSLMVGGLRGIYESKGYVGG